MTLDKLSYRFLGGVHVFIAATTLAAAGLMVGWPDGSLLGLDAGILMRSPFHDFVLPGVLLYCLGIVNLTAAFFVFGRESAAPFVSGLAGIALMSVVMAELAMVHVSNLVTFGYGALALAVLADALWIRQTLLEQEAVARLRAQWRSRAKAAH